jgi:hypothetical protein
MRCSYSGGMSAKAVLQRSMREAREVLSDDMVDRVAEEARLALPGRLCCVRLTRWRWFMIVRASLSCGASHCAGERGLLARLDYFGRY